MSSFDILDFFIINLIATSNWDHTKKHQSNFLTYFNVNLFSIEKFLTFNTLKKKNAYFYFIMMARGVNERITSNIKANKNSINLSLF